MIVVILVVLGLALGSFVNALTWRLHEQDKLKAKSLKLKAELSILKGRSMCPHCRHSLATKDLLPVVSWLWLRGKCRYCYKPISTQYPTVELVTAGLFVLSYLYWPNSFTHVEIFRFSCWLVFLTGFMALAVYDLKWFLLPDKIIYPLYYVAILQVVLGKIVLNSATAVTIPAVAWGFLVGGGIFYLLFQVSNGKWIGGGDVKLGGLLGLILGGSAASLLMIFGASLFGTLLALPMMAAGKAKKDTHLPFGPFLLLSAVVVQLFGATLLHWYKTHLLLS